MRVTSAVREYVRKVVLAKVKDKLQKAEEAKEKAIAERDAKLDKAKTLCEKLRGEAQAKFVKEAKKIGLTWVPDTYNWYGELNEKGGNYALTVCVGQDDFAETVSSNCNAYKGVKSSERDAFEKVCGEPDRIREAAETAADKLLFDLELGKVAKRELDESLKDLEVKL